jgi:sulfonate transport system substrate-binding protein
MLQAFQADAIDIGFVGDTPLIFAQAARQDVVAVAAWASDHGSNELVAAPGSKINSWRDLKGKKLAFQQGTSLEAAGLQGLHKAGLSLSDVTPVHLPLTQISAALQGGSVDAGILVPPLDRAYLSGNPGAKVVDRSDDLTNRLSFIIASKSALADKAKAAAIREYVQRIARAYKSIAANPEAFVQSFFVGKYHLTPEAGRRLLTDQGTTRRVRVVAGESLSLRSRTQPPTVRAPTADAGARSGG